MYTGTPKGDFKPSSQTGVNAFDDGFAMPQSKQRNESDFNQKDKLFKLSKNLIDKKEADLLASRAPLHQNREPKQKQTGRGNSPATGALAGQPAVSGETKNTDRILSESKLPATNNMDDSFQKLYSKELDLDEDEVPLILHELNDSAIHFISKDQWDRALSLLQKAQTLLDRLMFQLNTCDRFLIQCTMHNMALCFQKMGAIEECSLCLDACLTTLNQPSMLKLYQNNPALKLKKLKYDCKIHMQVCALLSQLNRHQEALCHAKQSVQISQYMMLDLLELCEVYNHKVLAAKQREQQAQELISKGDSIAQQFKTKFLDHQDVSVKDIQQKLSKNDLIFFDDKVSMLERTAHKYYPIVKEAVRRMVQHKDIDSKQFPNIKCSKWIEKKVKELRSSSNDKKSENDINMKVLLGYLNQSEWMYLLNIGNIMQITPLTIHDLLANPAIEVELARDSVIEKMSYLAVSYFCVSTELRFLVNLKDNPNVDPVQIKSESEYWHGKALELSCTFLPSESPLVSHILTSYNKHHAPVKQIINEDAVETDEQSNLKVIRPFNGIDQAKQQPLIKANRHMHIALSPLPLSPNNYTQRTNKGTFNEFCNSMKTKVVVEQLEKPEQQQPRSHRGPKPVQAHYQSLQQQVKNENVNELNQMSNNFVSQNREEQSANTIHNVLPYPKNSLTKKYSTNAQSESILSQRDKVPRQEPALIQVNTSENKKNSDSHTKDRARSNTKERNEKIQDSHRAKNNAPQTPSDFRTHEQNRLQLSNRDKDNQVFIDQLDSSHLPSLNLADITNNENLTTEEKIKQITLVKQLMELSLINRKNDDTIRSFKNEINDVNRMTEPAQKDQDRKLDQRKSSHRQQQPQPSNNAQNLLKDQQIDFLKDTPIDQHMLTNKPSNERFVQQDHTIDQLNHQVAQQRHQPKVRPKTSENYRDNTNRGQVMVQQQHVQQMILNAKHQKSNKNLDLSANDGKFKSSQNTQYDTLDADLLRNKTNMSKEDPLQHNVSHDAHQNGQHNQMGTVRPLTQQNFYEAQRNQAQNHSSNNHQPSHRMPASANLSSSVTSGITSHHSVNHQQKHMNNPNDERQYSTVVNSNQPASNSKDLKLLLDHSHQQDQNMQQINNQQYNTVVNQHITPKNKLEKSSQKITDGNNSNQTRYKTNVQFQNSNQSTKERNPAISSHRGSSTTANKDVKISGPKMNQHMISNNIQSSGNSLESKKFSGKIMHQKLPLPQKSTKQNNELVHPQSHRAMADAQNLMKQQQRKNQSASGSRERKDNKPRQPAINSANASKVYSSQIIQKNFESKKSSVQHINPVHVIGTIQTSQSPNKEKRQNLEIQTKQKLVKQIRTNVQTPTQQNHPTSSKHQVMYPVNDLIMQAQQERSHSGEQPQKQFSSGYKGQNQVQLHQQMVSNSKNGKSQERLNGNVVNTAPVSRGNSAKNKQQPNVQINQLNQNINQRFATKKHLNADEIQLLKMNQQHKSNSQHKSRNNQNGMNGISKTVGVSQHVNAAGALVSHRVSVNHTLVDDISNINQMNMQLQKQLGSKQPNKMKLKMPKSQDKTRGGNYQTVSSQGQILTQRSNKMQLNMKAVLNQPHQPNVRPGGALHSMRLQSDKQRPNNMAQNSSQKFIIDQSNPNLNFQSLQQNSNTYTVTSLENTNQDMNIVGMSHTGSHMGLAFPSTPNIQSARGSAHGGMVGHPQIGSSRSIQSLQQSQQKQMPTSQQTSNQKQITIKKIIEGQQYQGEISQMENSYEILQRQRQMDRQQ